jgi:hypothetical protein
MWAKMSYRPEPFEVPAALKPMIEAHSAPMASTDPVLIRADLDDDGQNEYLLLSVYEYGVGMSQFYYLTDAGWQSGQLQYAAWRQPRVDMRELIESGEVTVVEPRFRDVRIGDIVLRPLPNEQPPE